MKAFLNMIILVLFLTCCLNAQEEVFCKRNIIESYDLGGHLQPRDDKMFLCPLI